MQLQHSNYFIPQIGENIIKSYTIYFSIFLTGYFQFSKNLNTLGTISILSILVQNCLLDLLLPQTDSTYML